MSQMNLNSGIGVDAGVSVGVDVGVNVGVGVAVRVGVRVSVGVWVEVGTAAVSVPATAVLIIAPRVAVAPPVV